MKYKGFCILPVYSLCADWTLDQHNRVVSKKPTSSDIEYYEILDPMENDKRWIAEDTVRQCKETIDTFLKKVGMKDNTPKSWEKLQ
jgi:hypothetical protein